MKKALLLSVALIVAAFSLPPTTSAVPLTNTVISDTQFESFAGLPVALSQPGSSIIIGTGTTQAILDSAAFAGTGIAKGLYVYTYRLTVTTGAISALLVPFGGIQNVVTGLDLNGNGSPDTSFQISSGLLGGGVLAGVYGSNGTVSPDVTANIDSTGVFQANWLSTIPAPDVSVVFGLISPRAPSLVIAGAIDGGVTTSSPLVVSPVPEPATLLLLGSGLTSVVALRWRRKREN